MTVAPFFLETHTRTHLGRLSRGQPKFVRTKNKIKFHVSRLYVRGELYFVRIATVRLHF